MTGPLASQSARTMYMLPSSLAVIFRHERCILLTLEQCSQPDDQSRGTFAGVAYSPDDKTLYIGGGTDSNLKIFQVGSDSRWSLVNAVSPPSSEPSGLSLSRSGDKLYVALNRATGFAIVDI